jgi:hypothetical protein
LGDATEAITEAITASTEFSNFTPLVLAEEELEAVERLRSKFECSV